MGIFSAPGDKELKDARRDLDDLGDRQRRAGIKDENPDYLKANQRVADAEQNASPLARWLR